MLECCHQDTKEAMICINNKYGLIKFTNFYQFNHNFSYFSTKTSYVIGSILNCGVVRLPILHALTRDAVSSFYVRIEIKLTQNSCKLTQKYFTYIIKELLNIYWWILALVGFNMHSQILSTEVMHHNIFLNKGLILCVCVILLKDWILGKSYSVEYALLYETALSSRKYKFLFLIFYSPLCLKY